MLQAFFHAWERQLAAVTTDRVVRPFDWGLEWIPSNGSHSSNSKGSPGEVLGDWVEHVMTDTDARTVQGCRQAVLDARRAIAWLAREGYERIGILGTSLGSCLALLTTAHEPILKAQALNHISPHFADVVWRGLSTRHVRDGLDGHIGLESLRALWRPISPRWYLDRVRDRKTLLVYARYDLTFPVDLSEDLVREFRERAIPHEVAVLGCGHYSSGKAPFKFVDRWIPPRLRKKAA